MSKSIPPLVLAGCFIAGIVVGYLNRQVTSGALLGAGTGFIAMSLLRMITKKKDNRPKDRSEDDS